MTKNGSMANGSTILAYGSANFLVLRNLDDPLQSEIYNHNIEKPVICVSFSPDGEYLAFGDDKGMVRVI